MPHIASQWKYPRFFVGNADDQVHFDDQDVDACCCWGGVYFLRSLFDVCAVCNYRRNQIGRLGFHKLNISHLRTPFHTLATQANLQTL